MVFLLAQAPLAPRVVAAAAAPLAAAAVAPAASSPSPRSPRPLVAAVRSLRRPAPAPLISTWPTQKAPGGIFPGNEKKEGFPSLHLLCLDFLFFLSEGLHLVDRRVLWIIDDLHSRRPELSRL